MGDSLTPLPHPAATYAEAVERTRAFDANPAEPLHLLAHTRLIGHGHKTEHAIIFLHGLTNNPQQFEELGNRFHTLGYNVLIPRLPHHGLANLLTDDLRHLTDTELVNVTQEAIHIAHGLGESVTVVGLSAGGVAAAWAGQFCAEVAQAVMLAPFFGVKKVSPLINALLTRVFLLAPNQFWWWNNQLKDKMKPEHAYPRFSTHSLAQVMRLGQTVAKATKRNTPACPSLIFVTDAFDGSVSNPMVDSFVECCRKSGAKEVCTYEFAGDLRLPHDMIDPTQPTQKIEIVYPKLIELITGQAPPRPPR